MKELIDLLQYSRDREQIEAIVRRIVCETWVRCSDNELNNHEEDKILLSDYVKELNLTTTKISY